MVCTLSTFFNAPAHLRNSSAAMNRRKLSQTEPKLVANLITLMDSPSLKVQCQAALALRNLASDGAASLALEFAVAPANPLTRRQVPA